MIKKAIHKIFSITLAFLVLFSTVSLTVEKHFCGDTLIDVSIFTEGEKCALEAFEIEQALITKKNCCKDQIDIIQGQNELNINTFEDLEIDQQIFLASFSYAYANLFKELAQRVIPHKDYSPPLLVTDIQVLDQVFII